MRSLRCNQKISGTPLWINPAVGETLHLLNLDLKTVPRQPVFDDPDDAYANDADGFVSGSDGDDDMMVFRTAIVMKMKRMSSVFGLLLVTEKRF